MCVIDLTEYYLEYVIQQDNVAQYEATYPQLFKHYYTFWAQPQPYSFRDAEEISRRRSLVLNRLPLLLKQFESKNLKIADIDLILFVGHGTSNGHAFPSMDRWLVWLPIETYHSSHAIDIFVSHELVHALHYRQQPAFYFNNRREKNQVFRQLVTEGIATLGSKEILGVSNEQALWADYLPFERVQQWYQACVEREEELFRAVADNLVSSNEQNRLFCFSESDDILENRAGYYAGLVLIERYAKQHSFTLRDLLAISKEGFWQVVRSYLKMEPA